MEQYAPGTAVEQYFNQLINMKLLTQVVVSDRQGNTILACFGTALAPWDTKNVVEKAVAGLGGYGVATGYDAYGGPVGNASGQPTNEEEYPMETNAAMSAARTFQHMEHIYFGLPMYLSAQYHDNVVVQFLEGGCCLVTLVGCRSQGHCVGGLLALIPQVRQAKAVEEMVQAVQHCLQ